MKKRFLKAIAIVLSFVFLVSLGTVTVFAEEAHCTVYPYTDFSGKLEISAPSEVTVGDEFEICFRWSDYTFTSCVSAFTVQFSFDTRYIVLAGDTEEIVTIIGAEKLWTDCSNYGNGEGLGAVEATDKNTPSVQEVSISFFNEEDEFCLEGEFIVKVKFKAVYAGDPQMDWHFMELYDRLFEYEIAGLMEEADFSVSVTDGSSAPAPETNGKGDVNGDGKADNLDAAWILRHDAKLFSIPAESIADADVNGDGRIDSLDAAKILRYDAGLISEL